MIKTGPNQRVQCWAGRQYDLGLPCAGLKNSLNSHCGHLMLSMAWESCNQSHIVLQWCLNSTVKCFILKSDSFLIKLFSAIQIPLFWSLFWHLLRDFNPFLLQLCLFLLLSYLFFAYVISFLELFLVSFLASLSHFIYLFFYQMLSYLLLFLFFRAFAFFFK